MAFSVYHGGGDSSEPAETGQQGYYLLQDRKPPGVEGGASIAGVQVRELNTIVSNPGNKVTLASNQFTITVAGATEVRVSAMAPVFNVGPNQAFLWDVIVGQIAVWIDGSSAIGTSSYQVSGTNNSFSFIEGVLALPSGTNTFEIRHSINGAVVNGLGTGAFQGFEEIFTVLKLWL